MKKSVSPATTVGPMRRYEMVKDINGKKVPQNPLYFTWKNMMRRCYDPREVGYYMYGAAGVTVCERWHDRRNFFSDMYPKPEGKHSIDRIDGTKGYSPENCRWATIFEQNGNKRTNRWIIFNGQRKHPAEWSRITGIQVTTIRRRMKAGWTPEQILNPAKFHRWRRPA